MQGSQTYEDLVHAALAAPFSGWGFSYLDGRVRDCELPWSYEDLARAEISPETRLLDLDTGGGETLADILGPLRPAHVAASEPWLPNLPVARSRLEPLGVSVRLTTSGMPLPADDGEFDLVLNRHGGVDPDELRRVLSPAGIYLSQGVGRLNDIELNAALDGPPPGYSDGATLDHSVSALTRCGFHITRSEEAFADFGFLDIGALVFHLQAVSWQVPGFDVTTYDRKLREIDAQIRKQGEFTVHHHRFLIRALRP
jgi:SAM-dependent methyltransferase